MLPDRVSNPGPLTYESGALPIALRGLASSVVFILWVLHRYTCISYYLINVSCIHVIVHE